MSRDDGVPAGPGSCRRNDTAYVWLKDKDGKEQLVNEAVLAGGHAVLDTRVPNVRYVKRLTAAQKAAREAKKNIWDEEEPLTETPAEYAKKAAEKKPEVTTLEKWEEGCVIGNKKTKKYHVSGGQYYNASKDSANARVLQDGGRCQEGRLREVREVSRRASRRTSSGRSH